MTLATDTLAALRGMGLGEGAPRPLPPSFPGLAALHRRGSARPARPISPVRQRNSIRYSLRTAQVPPASRTALPPSASFAPAGPHQPGAQSAVAGPQPARLPCCVSLSARRGPRCSDCGAPTADCAACRAWQRIPIYSPPSRRRRGAPACRSKHAGTQRPGDRLFSEIQNLIPNASRAAIRAAPRTEPLA